MRPRSDKQPKDPAGGSFLWTLALLGVAVAAVAFTGLVGSSARAARADIVAISGQVSGPLRPGLTTTVTVTVAAPPAGARPIDEVALRGIATDPAHAGCPTSVGGTGAAFTMPRVRLGRAPGAVGGLLVGHGRLTMNATGGDQDACEGARLTLSFVGR